MKQIILALVFLSLALQAVAGDVPAADSRALDTSSGIFVPSNGTLDLAGSRYVGYMGEAAAMGANLLPWPGAKVAIDVAGVVEDASIHAVERETLRTEGDLLQVGKEAARLREIRAEGRDPKRDPEGQRILAWLEQQSRHTWEGRSYLRESLRAHMGYTLVLDGTTLVASKVLAGPVYRRLFKANGMNIAVNMHWNGRNPLFARYDRAAKLAWKGWWKGLPDEAQKGVVEAVLNKSGNASLIAAFGSGARPHSTSASMAPTLAMPAGSGGTLTTGYVPLSAFPRAPLPVVPLAAPAPAAAPAMIPVAAPAPVPAPPIPLAAPAAVPAPVVAPALAAAPLAPPAARPAARVENATTYADLSDDDLRAARRASVSRESASSEPTRTHVEIRTHDEWRYVPVPAGFDGAGNPQFNYVWHKFPSARTETVVVPDGQ